jgi:hypothetical protein
MTVRGTTLIRLMVAGALGLAVAGSAEAVVIDFEDLGLAPGAIDNGDPGNLSPGQVVSVPIVSGGVSFANTYGIDSFGGYDYPYWLGFAASAVDTVVSGTAKGAFTDQYTSYPGGGFGSPTYMVAYDSAAVISLPVPTTVSGFRIANTAYTYCTMANGDEYNFAQPLVSGTGWFAVTATGRLAGNLQGTAEFFLADLRGAEPLGIRAGWTWFDLTPLGTVDTIEFSFAGAANQYNVGGLVTPAYFALDDLTVAAVPEPSGLALLVTAAGAIGGLGWWRRRPRVA